jgi:hypothetical protein
LIGWTAAATEPVIHRGICDASAAVEISAGIFMVANDEDNILRLYRTGKDGPALVTAPSLSTTLGAVTRKGNPRELDLEGTAVLDGKIYLIGSHGRSRKTGKVRPTRQRLFAITLVHNTETNRVTFELVGVPYTSLIADLIAHYGEDSSLDWLDLESAAMRAPGDPGGLNIEGLSATADGSGLLIGMGNPLGPDGRAILIPLTNPEETISGKPAVFGEPLTIDLTGRGIRSIDYVEPWKHYVIIAGPTGGDGDFAVYRWSGQQADAPVEIPLAWDGESKLTPEAIFHDSLSNTLHVLSDDGKVAVTHDNKTRQCKDWGKQPAVQSFREWAIDFRPVLLRKPPAAVQ